MGNTGASVYARVAKFDSVLPASTRRSPWFARGSNREKRRRLEGVKMLMLVNRQTGKGLGVRSFESEEAMRRGDEALNALNPGGTERRTADEFVEVPVQTVR